jgi:hypothetical protein
MAQHTIHCEGAKQAAAQASTRREATAILAMYEEAQAKRSRTAAVAAAAVAAADSSESTEQPTPPTMPTTPNITVTFGQPELLQLEYWPEFCNWLTEPLLGYQTTGPQRRIRSGRTLTLLREDLVLLLKHVPTQPPTLVCLCDDNVMSEALKQLAQTVKGASRYYNILSAAHKVILFFTTTYKVQSPSLSLVQTLTRQYNRLRCVDTADRVFTFCSYDAHHLAKRSCPHLQH